MYFTASYDGLAVDPVRQKLYYADAHVTGGSVGELSTDGTEHREMIRHVSSKPRALVIDTNNRSDLSTSSDNLRVRACATR